MKILTIQSEDPRNKTRFQEMQELIENVKEYTHNSCEEMEQTTSRTFLTSEVFEALPNLTPVPELIMPSKIASQATSFKNKMKVYQNKIDKSPSSPIFEERKISHWNQNDKITFPQMSPTIVAHRVPQNSKKKG